MPNFLDSKFIRLAVTTTLALAACASLAALYAGAAAPDKDQQRALAKMAPIPTSTTTQTVNDPAFNGMPAIDLQVPSGWKIEGEILTPPCSYVPFPVYREYSPDGLLEFRAMPVFGWKGARDPRFLKNDGCLPFSQVMSAAEFLQKYVELIHGGVHIVGPMPVDQTYAEHAQAMARSANPGSNSPMNGRTTADTAALRVETMNGSFLIEQRLRAQVQCTIRDSPQLQPTMQGIYCWARVDATKAPKGKLDALVAFVDGHNIIKNQPRDQWQSAVMQRMNQQSQEMMAELTRLQHQWSAMLKQQHDEFMETSRRNHEAFMQQQEASFQSSMRAANDSMNARSTSTSDWVDYALDRQTVAGPDGIAKVSNQDSHVWSTTIGNQTYWYGSNDANANPNGVLQGNWTEDTRVHGNGQPF
jgi:hypothetical protein